MNLLDLIELLELDNLDLISPASPLKIVTVGKSLKFGQNTKVIDFGSGRADALILWAKFFGVTGVGVESYDKWCQIAEEQIQKEGLGEKLQVICTDASTYEFAEASYDVASCLGASMIWNGFRPTLQNLKRAIHQDGTIIIGEPYFVKADVPYDLVMTEGRCHTESELLEIIHDEGLEIQFYKRANSDELDAYRSHFRNELQEMSFKYMQNYEGWTIYVLKRK